MTDFEWIEAITAKAQAACHPRGRGRLTQLNDITNALPVIVAEVLAPIEAKHRPRTIDSPFDDSEYTCCAVCERTYGWPCPTAQAIADIRKAVGA